MKKNKNFFVAWIDLLYKNKNTRPCVRFYKKGAPCVRFSGFAERGENQTQGRLFFLMLGKCRKSVRLARHRTAKKQKGLSPSCLYSWHFAVMSESPFANWVAIADRPTVAITHPTLEGVARCGCDNLACG
jgi:hypothetical protein